MLIPRDRHLISDRGIFVSLSFPSHESSQQMETPPGYEDLEWQRRHEAQQRNQKPPPGILSLLSPLGKQSLISL
jgi:hypothetical protein